MKAITMFSATPIKIPMTFITAIEKISLKVHLKTQKNTNSQGNMSKKSNAGGITILNIKLYHKTIAMKQQGTGTKDNCNAIEDSDRNPHSYAHLSFDKYAKNTQWK
jgi:hypothetical protein